jgi:TonB family protein
MGNRRVVVSYFRIALVGLITILAAKSALSQDAQKETPSPQNPAGDSSQSDAPTASRLRVPGNVAAAMLIHQVMPVYPAAAKEQHVEGTLLLHAIIGKDGTLQALKYVSGPPALMHSAMDAVKQWQYKPTLLNGEPVEVDTTISVVYALGEKNPNNAEGSTSPSDVPGSPSPQAAAADSSQDAQKEAATQSPASATPEPNAPAQKPKRIRVGGNVAQAQLVHQVTPVYPNDAKMQRISGTVLLHAIIATDGTVRVLEYVSGPSALMKSAMDAVKEWRYRPTLLNGDPVEVDTTIAVVYTFGNH